MTGPRRSEHGFTFSTPFRVRFDEAAPDGLLRTSSVLRYAQDLAWQHSADRGFDRAWYADKDLTWLVRTAELRLLAPIEVGSTIIGTTGVVGYRRVWSRRHSDFRDTAGTIAATADIDWVLLDGRGAPTRIPPIFEEVFGAMPATFPLGRVALDEPPTDALRLRFDVRPQELDPLDHVNNAVYADWFDEAILAAGDLATTRSLPRVVRLEYALPAGPGETLEATVWPDPDGWSYRLIGPGDAALLRAHWSRTTDE
jgi:acyl-CoA thioesterase FadM